MGLITLAHTSSNILSMPLHAYSAVSHLVTDKLTDLVLKFLTNMYRCLNDDLTGI